MHDFFMGAHLAFRAVYALFLYAASAVSLYQIAKNNSVPNPWIAFIPILQYYIIGSLCGIYDPRFPHSASGMGHGSFGAFADAPRHGRRILPGTAADFDKPAPGFVFA